MSGLDANTKLLIHANKGVAAGEYAHYKLNDNAANTTVTDSGSGANNGTASANTSTLTTTGKINQALAFNGSSQYVNVDTLEADIGSDTKGTISVWVNKTALIAERTIFGIGGTSTDNYFSLNIHSSGKIRIGLIAAGANKWTIDSSDVLTAGSWFHLALVHDGISPKLYINGVKQTETFLSSVDKTVWFSGTTTDNGRIGCLNTNGSGNILFWDGSIDDFRYYQNIALGQEAISAIYNVGTGTENSLIVDASASAHPITAYGNTYVVPAVPNPTTAKLASGGGNALFNGTSSYLSLADSDDWSFGTGDFTVEFWIYSSDVEAQRMIIGQYADGSNMWRIQTAGNGTIDFNWVIGGVDKGYYYSSRVVQFGKWHHIAVVRNGTSGLLFVDGVSKALTTGTSFSTNDVGNIASSLYVGTRGGALYHAGYLDELRISKGIARYTANFTPSLRHTADADTKLLLHFDTNVTTDSETTPKTVTNNNTVIWNAGSKWNSGALAFDGTGDYLSIPDSVDWDVVGSATDNWTIDLQVSHKDHSGNEVYVAQAVDASNQLILYHTDTAGIKWQLIVSGSILMDIRTGNEITDNSWHHVAAIKNGSYYAVYKDGVQGSYFWYPGVNTFAANLTIGDNVQTLPFDGNMDELRIQHSNYFLAAPNSYPAAPLLLYGEGVDEATTMANNGYSGAVTMSGGAKLDNAQKKFNATTSMFFDGASDYLSVVDTSGTDYDIFASATDSWTIDLWYKRMGDGSNLWEYLVNQWEDANNIWGLLYHRSAGNGLRFYAYSGGYIVDTGYTGILISDTNWHHIAMVKSGANYACYLDGVQVNYVNDSSTDTYTGSVTVGATGDAAQGFINGYLEQVQITKGNKFGVVPDAGLTTTITVPTAVLTQNTITEPTEEYDAPALGRSQAILIA